MHRILSLTVAQSKRLIAKGIAQWDVVKRALDEGFVAVGSGTTNGYIIEELTGEPFAKLGHVTGRTLPANYAGPKITYEGHDLVLHKGERLAIGAREALEQMGPGDVFMKGANALNYERAQAAVLIGHPHRRQRRRRHRDLHGPAHPLRPSRRIGEERGRGSGGGGGDGQPRSGRQGSDSLGGARRHLHGDRGVGSALRRQGRPGGCRRHRGRRGGLSGWGCSERPRKSTRPNSSSPRFGTSRPSSSGRLGVPTQRGGPRGCRAECT